MRIALRALTKMSISNPIKGEDLAFDSGTTKMYMDQILAKLTRSGLVCAKRGPKGGYLLKDRPIDAYDVACALGYKEIDTMDGVGQHEIDNVLARALVSAYKSLVIR
jgi:DNA-binding IscR family transcriptional regulator